MKPVHSKEYFEKYKESLFEKYKRECDFEYEMRLLLPDFSAMPSEIVEKVKPMLERVAAKKVCLLAEEKLIRDMHVIKEIKSGRASLGYVSLTQEVRAWADMNECFEFSCYMLGEFKRKYAIS